MQQPHPAGVLTEAQRANAVLFLAGGLSLAAVAAGCGCTLRQLQQEMQQNAQFGWQMEHAKQIIAAQSFLQIVRAAATQPPAANWLLKHLDEGAPLIDFVLTSLFPRL